MMTGLILGLAIVAFVGLAIILPPLIRDVLTTDATQLED